MLRHCKPGQTTQSQGKNIDLPSLQARRRRKDRKVETVFAHKHHSMLTESQTER
jgi:hypothetical protein